MIYLILCLLQFSFVDRHIRFVLIMESSLQGYIPFPSTLKGNIGIMKSENRNHLFKIYSCFLVVFFFFNPIWICISENRR